MFRCKTCKKIYTSRVRYCDCGSDDFEQMFSKAYEAPKKDVSSGEAVSWVVFVLCLMGAVLVWFI